MENNESNTIDQLFLRIILKNDEEAFRSLFFEYFSPLCVFAHRYIDSWETCEDIVQDVFFKIWKNKKQIVINTSGKNFLITSIRNSSIDYLRKKQTESDWQEILIKKQALNSEQHELNSIFELEEMLTNALNRLPEKIRIIFEENRFEGKTYAQIASEHNISLKTVEAYISKALKQLRIELKDYLPFILLFL
ncbi:RNA polymerase sigma-70 factor [Bacteroides sp. 519]|uniref:RNA polymerase sigma-70 factor n=1 Tax=Bacteroides sp. 519 TaxID=2302937 RepID=UPI0013CFD331|nr:RNA polymerase sigma-70 factor [Bacteroides sp. 519]NDV59127.1 RNA polymerase sigma-70 factor [Bacteroides sp. 519]